MAGQIADGIVDVRNVCVVPHTAGVRHPLVPGKGPPDLSTTNLKPGGSFVNRLRVGQWYVQNDTSAAACFNLRRGIEDSQVSAHTIVRPFMVLISHMGHSMIQTSFTCSLFPVLPSLPFPHYRHRRLIQGCCAGVVACAVSLISGCSGDSGDFEFVTIKGTVTYNGEPLDRGQVVYSPAEESGGGRAARGSIQPDGSFQMRTSPSVPGVVHGKYAISIFVPEQTDSPTTSAGPSSAPVERPSDDRFGGGEEDKPTIPAKYASAETSGLEDTVTADHSGVMNIVLID